MDVDPTPSRPWWRVRFGLSGQLFIALLAVVLTLVLTLGGIALWSVDRALRKDAWRRADTTANLAATLVRGAVEPGRPLARGLQRAQVLGRLRDLQRQADAVEVLVVMAGGERIRLGNAGLPIEPSQDASLAASLAGRTPATQSRAAPSGSPHRGALVVAYRTTRLRRGRSRVAVRVVVAADRYVDRRLGPTRTVLVVLAVVDGVLVFLFGLLFLRRRILRPLRALEQATARVAAGDHQTRLPVQRDDDLSRLTARFNDMLDRLHSKDRRLRSQVQELEGKQRELDQSWELLLRSAKLASVGRLTAGVAHELGNPMSSILGYVELLSDPDATDEQRERWIEKIRAEMARMDQTIRALLDTARPGDDSVVPTDLARVIRQAAELVKHQKRLREVDVRLQLEPLPTVASSARLSQVFVNLLLNAGDALEARGEVVIRARTDGDRVRVEVQDDGPGIPEAIRKELFDPFVTTKAPGAGTGLGLAISQSILEAGGGQIRVATPQPATGALFEIELQRWTEPDDDKTG